MRALRWKVLSSSTKTCSWGSWTPSIKTKDDVAFLTGSFSIANSLNIDISSKMRLCSTVDLFSVVRVILFKRRCATLKNGYIDVVQRWFNIVSTLDTGIVSMLCNIENPTSDFVSFSTSDKRYFNDDPHCWNNVDPTLKCWLGSIKEEVNS